MQKNNYNGKKSFILEIFNSFSPIPIACNVHLKRLKIITGSAKCRRPGPLDSDYRIVNLTT